MVRPAPVRAVPGYAPAGAGLPEYLPGEPAPNYPHAPPGERVLPHTAKTSGEPTIWASHQPAADTAPEILGIKLPLPENYSDLEFGEARACAAVVGIASQEAGTAYALTRLPSKAKKCAVAMLFQNCIDTMKLKSEKDLEANVRDAAVILNARRRVSATARAFAEKSCPPEATPTDAVNLVATTNAEVFKVVKR